MSHVVLFCGYSTVGYGTRPAGAYSIANVFRRLGLSTIVVDMVFGLPVDTVNELVDKFVGPETKFVCLSTTLLGPSNATVSFMGENDARFEPIFRRCKSRAPNAKFVIGGSKINYGESSGLDFDYCIKGQGETCVRAMVNAELFGYPLSYTLDGKTRVLSDKTYGVGDFNTSQNLVFYEEDGILPDETLVVEFGRGCAFKCSFCSYDLVGKNFGDYTRSADALYHGLIHNYERFGTTRYIIVDDTINESIDKARLLLDVSQRLPFKLRFGGYFRIELFQKHPEMAQMYLDAGLVGVVFGVETFNKEAGAVVGKGFGERAKDVLADVRSVWGQHVNIATNFIVGLPNDTMENLERQQRWIEENSEIVDNARYTALAVDKGRPFPVKDYYTLDDSDYEGALPREVFELYKRKSVMWKSPLMTFVKAISLSSEFTKRLIASRGSIVGILPIFASLPLESELTLQQQRQTPMSQLKEVIHNHAVHRIRDYTAAMRRVTNPVWELPSSGQVVEANRDIFQSKVVFNR